MKKHYLLAAALIFLGIGASNLWAESPAEAYTKGMKYYDQSLWDQAVESLQQAVKLDPQHWEAYQMLSYAYYKLNDRKASAEAAESSLRIHSNNPKLRQFADRVKSGQSPSMPPPPDERTASASEASAAETTVQDSIYVNIGGSNPYNPKGFTTSHAFGYNGGVGFGLGLSRIFQLVFDANLDNFPLNTSALGLSGASGGGVHIATVLANARVRFIAENNPVVPYFIGGLGAAFTFQDEMTNSGTVIAASASNTYFALRLGIGLDFRLSDHSALFLETNGVGVFDGKAAGFDNTVYNSFRLGAKFNL